MIFNLSETNSGGGTAVIDPLSVTANGVYTASGGVDGYSPVTVDVPTGIIIPDGYGYYNGYLLPLIPYADGYDYAWIRKNEQNDTFDLVLGTSQWRSRSAATLDNWQLEFANQAEDESRQYSIPQDGSATDWGSYVTSTNYYGTSNNRKVIWASHDIRIGTSANILYRAGVAITGQ